MDYVLFRDTLCKHAGEVKIISSVHQVFRIGIPMRCRYLDVQCEKHVRNDTGEVCLDDMAKQAVCKEYNERLLNVEFDWDLDSLSEVFPVEGQLVTKAIKLMKCGKAAGTSLILADMRKASELKELKGLRISVI